MKRVATSLILFTWSLLWLAPVPALAQSKPVYTRYSQPKLFTYDELKGLLQSEKLDGRLKSRLNTVLTTPFVSNEAFYAGAKPRRPSIEGLGPSLRVAMWNIERGVNLGDIILLMTNKPAFLAKVNAEQQKAAAEKGKGKKDGEEQAPLDRKELEQQIDVLQMADVVILNEVDWGMKRSGYAEVVRDLGRALKMNWAYGVEFVEVDAKVLGLETFDEVEDAEEREKLTQTFSTDPRRLRALHGTAVLSRYPIRSAELRPFELQGHDWYADEMKYGAMEKASRKLAALVGEKLVREVRRGGRTSLIVTLDVPDLPDGRLIVAATHLENRTKPKTRGKQMRELLDHLHSVSQPIVIAGDLNTTGSNGETKSVKNKIMNNLGSSEYWSSKAIKYATGVGFLQGIFRAGFKMAAFQNDPTKKGVPMLAENPEYDLFNDLEDFRFKDEMAIDFRGDESRTVNQTAGTLANSNQRQSKGFVPTFQFERTVGDAGKFKLDWIFVKAFLKEPRGETGPYRFSPHFARSMAAVNFALPEPISDHVPITVDLPFREPGERKK